MNQEQFDMLMSYIDARILELIETRDPIHISEDAARWKDFLFEALTA